MIVVRDNVKIVSGMFAGYEGKVYRIVSQSLWPYKVNVKGVGNRCFESSELELV